MITLVKYGGKSSVPPRLRKIICIHAIWNLYDRWEGDPGVGAGYGRFGV